MSKRISEPTLNPETESEQPTMISDYENFILYQKNTHTNPNCKDHRFCKHHGSLEEESVFYETDLLLGYIRFLENKLAKVEARARDEERLSYKKSIMKMDFNDFLALQDKYRKEIKL